MQSDWIGGRTGNWATGSNWQSGSVPGATDDVLVQGAGSATYTLAVTDAESAGSLLLDDPEATLQVAAGGALTLAGTLAPLQGTLTLQGTLVGGTLTGTGALDAAGGTLDGTTVLGTLQLAPSGSAYAPAAIGTLYAATLALPAGNALQLDDTNLILLTDAAPSGATLELGSELDGDDTLTATGHTLTLAGATTLATSAGGTLLGGTLVNHGTISAQGLLTYGGGHLVIAADDFVQAGTLTATNEVVAIDGAAFDNSGTISLSAASVTLAASTAATNTGVISVGLSAGFTAATDLSGAGTLLLGPNSRVALQNVAGTVQLAPSGSGTLTLEDAPGFTGTLVGLTGAEQLGLQGLAAAPVSASWTAGTLSVGEADGSSFNLALPGAFGDMAFSLAPAATGTGFTLGMAAANCFLRGTRIRARRGEVPVEALGPEDEIWSPRARAWRPVLWVGRRRLDARRHPDPDCVRPVRIAAGALGPGLPARELALSPDHGLFVAPGRACPQGALVPARLLLGSRLLPGRGATQAPAGPVEYCHVEVAGHDVLLAEGVAAETFLDDGSRAGFSNGAAHLVLHPELARRGAAEPCAPYRVDAAAALLLLGRRRPRRVANGGRSAAAR